VAACENSNLMQATGRVAKGVSLRFGYAADRWLFYVKGGGAWASDSYSVPGAFTGVPFDFEGLDLRFGWTVAAVSNGHSPTCGRPDSNTTIISSATAAC